MNIQKQSIDAVAKAIADSIGHGMSEKCFDHARAALTAAAPYISGVKVKQLEWESGVVDVATPLPGMKYVACSSLREKTWSWWLEHVPETRSVCDTEEAAKAAAQADYEKRIMSALEPSSAREQALEEAAQIVEVKLTQAMTGHSVVGRMLHVLDGKLIREIAAAIRALKSQPAPQTGGAE